MVSVYCAPIDDIDGIVSIPALIERISMDGDLHIIFIGDVQKIVESCSGETEILMYFESPPGLKLLDEGFGFAVITLPQEEPVQGNPSTDSIILRMFQGPGVAVTALVPSAGPVPPPT